jgi:CIC family chloride channel protein
MKSESSVLRDFTVDSRVWLLSAVALIIGIGATFLAVVLLQLIAVATNLFYYRRLSAISVTPARSPLGPWMMMVKFLVRLPRRSADISRRMKESGSRSPEW